MSNESKPQEWFYLQNETWNGPFKTSVLKDLVKKGIVGPSTLLRIGIAGVPIKAHQVKSLFPHYQTDKQATSSPIKKESIPNKAPILIGGVILIVFIFGIILISRNLLGPKVSSTFKSTADAINIKQNNFPRISLAESIASIEKEMIMVPSGIFMMGDPANRLQVTIAKPFYLGKYEVNQEHWEAVMGDNPSSTKGANLPVTNVSWDDCQEFIKKLNANTKGGYRLPSEAEWEYACRAGTTTAYSFGDEIAPKDANYKNSNIDNPVAVGSYKPNAFGLFDMHGNAWEWCNDWYVYADGSGSDGSSRVLRGGSFNDYEVRASSYSRLSHSSSFRFLTNGLRLARTVDIKADLAVPIAPNAPTVFSPNPAVVMPATGNILVAPFTEAKAKEIQKTVAKSLQKEVEDKENLGQGIKLVLVLIPAGKFKMGDPGKEHEVTLTKPFYIGKYEVTQEQWEGVMGDNPSGTKGAKLPVTNVSWNDCQDYIRKLNANTNGGYRLPSEAEWEYACRAGTTTAYSFGDSLTMSDANYGHGLRGSTKPVGSYSPNAFGLHDMHGNVWEYCEDWAGEYPVGSVTDPTGATTGKELLVRGGAFSLDESFIRSSKRGFSTPSNRGVGGNGFRLARTP